LATQKSLHPAKKAAARAIARPTFDAFISHASADALGVKRLVRALEADSLTTWTDYSAVAFGKLLRPELQGCTRDRKHAAAGNRSVGTALRHLQDIAPEDPLVLNLTAYQYKNTYMLKYWSQIQAGRAPKDRLLARAERNFFDVLSGNPSDESAINGLGTVLFYERELEAAAFFQRRAAALAKRRGMDYQAAKSDLQQTLQHMRQQR
jgi:hypothetical protein